MAFAVKHSMPERISALSESDQRIARDFHPVFGKAFQATRNQKNRKDLLELLLIARR